MHLEAEEQVCQGAVQRIEQLDRWRILSEGQVQRMNHRYYVDIKDRDEFIAELREEARTHGRQMGCAERDVLDLQQRVAQEESMVVNLKDAVKNSDAVHAEMIERMDTSKARCTSRTSYASYGG